MHFLTDFADLGLVLPLTGLVALALVLVGRRRDAIAWTVAISGTCAAMLLLKLAVFIRLGGGTVAGLGNPSGHTAAGIVVYAGLVTLVCERFAPRMQVALLAGAVFGLIFGFSRFALRYHSLPDVLVGGAVGLVGVLVLARLAGPRRADLPAYGLGLVAAVSFVAVAALHGTKFHAESALRSIAADVRSGV